MIHKHSITKNILDATPVILGAAQGSDMVTFAYGTLPQALRRTQSGEIEFGVDNDTSSGMILVGGTPVTSKILDVTAVQKANASTGVKTITVTYVDPTKKESTGKSTSTFEVIDDAAVKSYITNANADLVGDSNDTSTDDTIKGAKKYADEAGWSINYATNTKKIQLLNQAGTVISDIDATDFIKDGMIDSVTLITEKPATDNADYGGAGPWLLIIWNSDAGKTRTVINVDTLVDTYTSGNTNQLTITNNQITPVTQDPSTASTAAQRAGLATAGLVKDYVDAKVTSKNVSASGETGASALVTASAADNAVTVASTQKLQTAVALAETAVQSVVEGTSPSEEYVALTVVEKSSANSSTVTITISDAALVTKFGIVDTSINNNNSSISRLNSSVNTIEGTLTTGITGQGDTYVSLQQDDSNKLKLNAGATAALTTAVANANSALQSGAVGTNATNYLTNARTTNTSTLTVDFAAAPINTSTGVNALTGTDGSNQFVTAKAIKEYVDSKTSAALSWIMLTN